MLTDCGQLRMTAIAQQGSMLLCSILDLGANMLLWQYSKELVIWCVHHFCTAYLYHTTSQVPQQAPERLGDVLYQALAADATRVVKPKL